jgi:FlaA1/EpsC-like NDP-sugar epimerase
MDTKQIKEFDFLYLGKRYIMFLFKRINPRWLIFLIDIFISLFSILLAISLRFNFNIFKSDYHVWISPVLLVLSVRFVSFLISRVYAGIVRYTSTRDIFRILFVNSVGSLFLILLGLANSFFFSGNYPVPFSIIVIDFIATVCFMMLFRFTVKLIYNEFSHFGNAKTNVIIFGSKELAVLAKRVLQADLQAHYRVVAFIGTSPLTLGKQLEGVTVYSIEELPRVIIKHNADQLLFATTALKSDIKNEIVQICLNHHVKVFTIPAIQSWIKGDLKVKNIKKLNIEDLLSREPIVLDENAIRSQLKDSTVLITGAAGSIGSEIVRQVIKYSVKRIVLVDQAETPMYNLELELLETGKKNNCEIIIADITSRERMEKIFVDYRPEIVYHAAAYKHVPMMETNPLEAIRNNVFGTRLLADLANKYGVAKFIFISTDKAVNPTNIMGASKRIAEMYVQALNEQSGTAYITTRFGNVLGSNGSVIPLFKRQIDAGGPITLTHPEVTRFFMTISEACQLVLEASAIGKGGEIFIFDMGQSVKILDLAKNMIRLSGLEPDIDIQIKFVGLRPGEKLYEELLHQSEDNLPTHHPKIMIALVREQNMTVVNKQIMAMENSIRYQNELELVKQMKEIVPEFISRNSEFEKLDKENQFEYKISMAARQKYLG